MSLEQKVLRRITTQKNYTKDNEHRTRNNKKRLYECP